jgi:uncharacterized protein YceH (UPF0502 family)
MNADAIELRVLGCLIEKHHTTPDAYPLTLNALRTACNQSTNRDPVVEYDERTVHEALHRLSRRGWARLTSGAGSRTVKYRQLLDRELGLDPPDLALLCVLMLRGPQTPGELKQRTERLHRFETLADVEQALAGLVERELAAHLPRRPGQKEERYAQLLGDDGRAGTAGGSAGSEPATAARTGAAEADTGALEARVARLEWQVAALRAELGLEDEPAERSPSRHGSVARARPADELP